MSHEDAARVRHFQPRVSIFDCRMTNYELLRSLVETPSRDNTYNNSKCGPMSGKALTVSGCLLWYQ